jgi:NAD(P)-dependent dehydrogenase (short-subunit alcohol dehydrogenase family)
MIVTIIGGTGGLGKEIAKGFHDKECIVNALSSKDLDIRDYKECKQYFDSYPTDILINASGVNHDKFVHKLGQEDQYMINYLMDVNLKGSVNIASACLPYMREKGYGRIIYISSVLAEHNVMGTALYSSCKAFIDRLTRSISAENIAKGITCNSIQLGYFDAGLTYKLSNPEEYKAKIPLKRWGKISELNRTIDYIINTEYLTGVNLPINGGVI